MRTETMRIERPVLDNYCTDFMQYRSLVEIQDRLTFDDFILGFEKEIGSGSFGKVAKVLARVPDKNDQISEGYVAAKFLAPSKEYTEEFRVLPLEERLKTQSMLKHRFLQEYNTMHELGNQHEGIIWAMRYGDHNNVQYFLMEYVNGNSLDFKMNGKKRKMHFSEFLDIITQVSKTLEFLHEYCIHRDLKPSNILIDEKGKAKLTDYGLIKHLTKPYLRDMPGQIDGTPLYMSPEQIYDHVVDHRTDVFSLGAVIYEYIAGKPPAENIRPEFKDEHLFDIYCYKFYNTLIPRGKKEQQLANLANKMLEFEVEKRPKISKVVEELEKISKPGILKSLHRNLYK